MHTQHSSQQRLRRLIEIGISLSSESNPERLVESILLWAKEITQADAGTLYLREKNQLQFTILCTDSLGLAMGCVGGDPIDLPPIPLYQENGTPNLNLVCNYSALTGQTIRLEDVYLAKGFDFSGTRAFDLKNNYRSGSFLTVPMSNHEHEVIGVLQLINKRDPETSGFIPFDEEDEQLAKSLASQAAVSLTKQHLIRDMEALFTSFAEVIATGIDAKSPHTAGHCRRVPTLTLQIAEAVSAAKEGPLASFVLTPEIRNTLALAAWLHDCGKISTPEWVMEKATKLYSLADRIELVETKLELLRRDLEIAELRAALEYHGGATAVAEVDNKLSQSNEQWSEIRAFLRKSNLGSEGMTQEAKIRVGDLAKKSWTNLDAKQKPFLTEDEIKNLTIPYGTLTREERGIINQHIVTTVKMLEQLPFPKHLRHIPEYAGGHHEHMDGTGYPKGLKGEQMSVPARIMAIADVFEALTASDRPYKTPKTIKESLSIMDRMATSGKLDPNIYEVFVQSGVWQHYAKEYLKPEQI